MNVVQFWGGLFFLGLGLTVSPWWLVALPLSAVVSVFIEVLAKR